MKKLLVFALLVSATGFSVGCSKEEPVRTRTVHRTVYRERGPAVGTPMNEGADNFRAVQTPDTYSGYYANRLLPPFPPARP